MTKTGNGCCAVKKLCEKQNKQYQHADGDQEFSQRKSAPAATALRSVPTRPLPKGTAHRAVATRHAHRLNMCSRHGYLHRRVVPLGYDLLAHTLIPVERGEYLNRAAWSGCCGINRCRPSHL